MTKAPCKNLCFVKDAHGKPFSKPFTRKVSNELSTSGKKKKLSIYLSIYICSNFRLFLNEYSMRTFSEVPTCQFNELSPPPPHLNSPGFWLVSESAVPK